MERVDVIELRAPAKINLSFRILRRRDDGFHEIETLMAPVSVFDRLTIRRADELRFTCDDASLPSGSDNLVVRAAQLFLDATKLASGVHIELEKRIPHGAGLGGGSSDAAATLLGMNQLLSAGLPQEALAKIAAEIGSDVPFFIFQSAARCSGRGELVVPATLATRVPLLLLKPSFGVPTPWAYSRWKDARELPEVSYAEQSFAGMTFVNDLERPVFEKHLFLARMKMWLLEQPEVGAAMLSGSGSTVFAAMRAGADADALARRAKSELDPDLWTCACETLTRQTSS
jgi:4-diphosphocytidyl-2-C-methyl-D-erythritol kinase